MQTIYNAQGEAKQCDPIDAKEHIATGRWFTEAPEVQEVKEEPQKRAYNKKAE